MKSARFFIFRVSDRRKQYDRRHSMRTSYAPSTRKIFEIKVKMPTRVMVLRECSRFVWHDKEFLVFIALTFCVYIIILCVHWPVTTDARREWEWDGDEENEIIKWNLFFFHNLICDGHGLRLHLFTLNAHQSNTSTCTGFVIGYRSRFVVTINGSPLELLFITSEAFPILVSQHFKCLTEIFNVRGSLKRLAFFLKLFLFYLYSSKDITYCHRVEKYG